MLSAIAASILAFTSSTDASKLEFWAAVGAAAGVVLFIRGFIMLRYKRLILNTPFSKIRSASMGLVEVTGTATGPQTIPAGITGEACYYYRAAAYQLRQSGKNRQWKCVADERVYVPFFVEDPTGRMLVDPQGADLDIHRNFKDEFDTSFFSSNRHMLPENVASFLARNCVSFTENTRLEEYCIKPDFPLFVLGTLSQNASRMQWTPVPHVIAAGSSHDSRLNLLGPTGSGMLQFLGWLPGSAGGSSGVTVSFNSASGVSSSPANQSPARTVPPSTSWSSVSMDEVSMSQVAAHQASAQSAAVQVDSQDVASQVATADPDEAPAYNPTSSQTGSADFDLHPPACISKGPNQDPYIISWHSQREVVRALAWKSALCIWGGPALTIACLYFLALNLGWT